MMERFEPLTSHVDCEGDDGTMSLTFKSRSAFTHAVKTWASINESTENNFILIANHAGCGPDDERQSYMCVPLSSKVSSLLIAANRISKIREDEARLTTILTARPAAWTEIAGTYDLDFGKALKATSQAQRRDLSDIGDGLKSIGDDIVKSAKQGVNAVANGAEDLAGKAAQLGDKTVTFSVAVGKPNQTTSIFENSLLKVDCLNCFITGSFQVTGHLSVSYLCSRVSSDC